MGSCMRVSSSLHTPTTSSKIPIIALVTRATAHRGTWIHVGYPRPCGDDGNVRVIRPHIFWDLDNLRPSDIEEARQLSELLVNQVFEHSNKQIPEVTAFGNDVTVSSISGSTLVPDSPIGMLEEALCGRVVQTSSKRKQSVDREMKQSMIDFAYQEPESLKIVACVSDDHDFVSTLQYCSSLPNCKTLVFGRFGSNKRPKWASARRLDFLPLALSVGIAVALRRDCDNAKSQRAIWKAVNSWCNPMYQR